MRVNVYTEELLIDFHRGGTYSLPSDPVCEIVTAEYVNSRTGQPMTNYGLRIFLKSAIELHHIPGRDDDRSAVTFWCGPKEKNVFILLNTLRDQAGAATLNTWRRKTEVQQAKAEAILTATGLAPDDPETEREPRKKGHAPIIGPAFYND